MTLEQLSELYSAGWRPIISITEDSVIGLTGEIPKVAPARVWESEQVIIAGVPVDIQYVIFSSLDIAPKLCSHCGVNPVKEPHTCPYQTELYDDYETMCDCCEECSYNCYLET